MRIATIIAGAALASAVGTSAWAQELGDPAAGERVFNKCRACHAVGPDAANKIGPALNGIIGNKPGTVEGYTYSPAFTEWAASVPAWDVAHMSTWLTDPRATVPGTKMVFPGIKDPTELSNVIAYLASFDETGASVDPATQLPAAGAAAPAEASAPAAPAN